MMGEQLGGNLANGNMQTLGRIGVYMVGGTAVGAAMGHGPESGWAEAEDLLGLAAWGSAGKGAGVADDDPNMLGLTGDDPLGQGEFRQFTKEELATKPPYSADPSKWQQKGGSISIDENGTWTYTDWEGNSVNYPGGYPDFRAAGMVQQEVQIGTFEGYSKDFAKADSLAPNGATDRTTSTWHHHQDGTTMQAIDKILHHRFPHIGGMAGK